MALSAVCATRTSKTILTKEPTMAISRLGTGFLFFRSSRTLPSTQATPPDFQSLDRRFGLSALGINSNKYSSFSKFEASSLSYSIID